MQPSRSEVETSPSTPPLSRVEAAKEPGNLPRILLVDDDDGVRGSLGELLTSERYDVLPAQDGEKALELLESHIVDLVVLDLNMPRKNGWETFERLRLDYPLTPVIVITARPNQLFTALNSGVGALLEKPLDLPIFLRAIQRLLSESSETRVFRLAGRRVEFHYAPGAKS